MSQHLMAAVAAAVVMSGVALAQTYPPAPPPVPMAPPGRVAGPPPARGPSTSTTTPAEEGPGEHRVTTVKKGVDVNGNLVTKKHTYREGVAGSTETHTKTTTNPLTGSTTRSTTTTHE